MTEIPTGVDGKGRTLSLAAVIALYSRRLLGAGAGLHPDAEVACEAIKMAVAGPVVVWTWSMGRTLEWEVLARHDPKTVDQAQAVVPDWCYGSYNHHRRHSWAAVMSPINYENTAAPTGKPHRETLHDSVGTIGVIYG